MFFGKKQIARAIDDYIRNQDSDYSHWYVGIASDPKDRLFNGHKVNEQKGQWVFSESTSEDAARTVERYFINVKGTQGDSGGGDASTRFIYAYRIYAYTQQ